MGLEAGLEAGLVYFRLQESLLKKQVKLTLDEQNLLGVPLERARGAFWRWFFVAGCAASLGTGMLQNVLQVPSRWTGLLQMVLQLPSKFDAPMGKILRQSFIAASALEAGLIGSLYSFDSSLEHILDQEGSQIHQELGNVMLSSVEKNPRSSIMKHFSKHFYLENVLDDLSTDKPKQVWRYRSSFGNGASTQQRTSQSNISSENTYVEPKPITVDNSVSAFSNAQRGDSFSKKESNGLDTVGDPFDWDSHTPVPERVEEVENAALSTTSHRRHRWRMHKRSQHRLLSKREASTDMQHAVADKGFASI